MFPKKSIQININNVSVKRLKRYQMTFRYYFFSEVTPPNLRKDGNKHGQTYQAEKGVVLVKFQQGVNSREKTVVKFR